MSFSDPSLQEVPYKSFSLSLIGRPLIVVLDGGGGIRPGHTPTETSFPVVAVPGPLHSPGDGRRTRGVPRGFAQRG